MIQETNFEILLKTICKIGDQSKCQQKKPLCRGELIGKGWKS
jgi:hypothetical protein